MNSSLPSLSVLARSKMQTIFGSGVKDASGLHRWVLLKNSIVSSFPSLPATTSEPPPPVYTVPEPEEEATEDQTDLFMFPLLGNDEASLDASESEWLDSLLETLGEEDDELDPEQASILSVDDDDMFLFSAASSSEDFAAQVSHYQPPTIRVPYPIPYPAVAYPSDFHTGSDDFSSLFDDALPYPFNELDDTEDMPVPDAIEDTSDDESDAPLTPSSQCSTPLLSMVAIPGLRHDSLSRLGPRVYVETDDTFPFADAYHDDSHNSGAHTYAYQEC